MKVSNFTLGSQAGIAFEAATSLMAATTLDDRLRSAMLLATTGGIVYNFLNPGNRRRELERTFPHRPEDLRYVLGLGVDDLAPLHGLRNSLMHFDERLEQHFRDNPGGPMSAWAVSDDLGNGEHMMAYKPASRTLIFGEDEVDVAAAATLLRLIQQRSGAAFVWLLPYTSVDVDVDVDVEDGPSTQMD